MKRLAIALLMGGLLMGCSEETTKEETKAEQPSEPVTTEEEPEKEVEQETKEEPKQEEPEEQVIDLQMPQVATYAWVQESTGIGWMSFYAVVENTGNTTIDLVGSSITYHNKQDEVIGTTGESMGVTPGIIEPGEKAYISAYEPLGDADPNNFKGATLTPQANPVEEQPSVVAMKNVSLQGEKVTGEFEEAQEMVNISSALLDADGNLLAILNGGEITANNFSLFDPPIPDEIKDQITSQETKAYKVQ